jgi:hypothetical protein
MEQNENQEIVEKLIERAHLGQHMEPEKILNWATYRVAGEMQSAISKFVKGAQNGRKEMFKKYLDSVKNGTPELSFLVGYKEMRQIEDFYIAEYNILFDMMKDYRDYVGLNPVRMVGALMGYDREDA